MSADSIFLPSSDSGFHLLHIVSCFLFFCRSPANAQNSTFYPILAYGFVGETNSALQLLANGIEMCILISRLNKSNGSNSSCVCVCVFFAHLFFRFGFWFWFCFFYFSHSYYPKMRALYHFQSAELQSTMTTFRNGKLRRYYLIKFRFSYLCLMWCLALCKLLWALALALALALAQCCRCTAEEIKTEFHLFKSIYISNKSEA